ncbi:ATP-binding cassette domain-containing protein [Nocardia salmonicida]|uniref:ATP-binding cassette domain-containing protein n=1 Tax=Nocardia salmonicida TaxID=53431 RepID=A0ABZ1N3I9_9NOCA
MNALVEVRDLTKHFPHTQGARVHAVENVSLTINRKETLSVVGESGCGKSTLAGLVMRLDRPTSGTVVLDGTDISTLPQRRLRSHRRKMQMVFQDPLSSLDPRRTAGDAVEDPLRIHRVGTPESRAEKVRSLFELVRLAPELRANYPHQFSGGQRQRVCIARALALEPELIVADEAVSALDVSVQASVLDLMVDLQDRLGLSYLFISHDLAIVEQISHRVAVMYLGQIVEIGSRDQVFGDPRHPYTRKLLDAAPIADPRRRRAHKLQSGEVPSPVWEKGTAPEHVIHDEVAPGHLVARTP